MTKTPDHSLRSRDRCDGAAVAASSVVVQALSQRWLAVYFLLVSRTNNSDDQKPGD